MTLAEILQMLGSIVVAAGVAMVILARVGAQLVSEETKSASTEGYGPQVRVANINFGLAAPGRVEFSYDGRRTNMGCVP